MEKISTLIAQRAKAFDAFVAFGGKKDFSDSDQPEYDLLKGEVEKLDKSIDRAKTAQALAASNAQPAPGQEETIPATVETDKYANDKSLMLGGFAKLIGLGGGNLYTPEEIEGVESDSSDQTRADQMTHGGNEEFTVARKAPEPACRLKQSSAWPKPTTTADGQNRF